MESYEQGAEAPSIVVLCGGSGGYRMLEALKGLTPDITAVVNMSDNGGSTGRLRAEYGMPPPGDVRQCLAALSEDPERGRWFNYRFGKEYGELCGHTRGNLILARLFKEHGGDFEAAISEASDLLQVRGSVVPVTLGNHQLVMNDDGQIIRGESAIDKHEIINPPARIWLEPDAMANPEAEVAVKNADVVAIAPGNHFCSILPVVAVNGIGRALRDTRAYTIAVTNLVTKPGHTDGWSDVDFACELARYVGEETIDFVLSNDAELPAWIVEKYAAKGEEPVAHDADRLRELGIEPIGANLVGSFVEQDPNDKAVRRTWISHNATEIGRIITDELLPRRQLSWAMA